MDYFDGNTVTALWNYAQRFAMSDNFYGTEFGPSTPGALNLISGDLYGASGMSPVPGTRVLRSRRGRLTRCPGHRRRLRRPGPLEVGRNGRANHQYDLSWFFKALRGGHLPAVSFLKAPAYADGTRATPTRSTSSTSWCIRSTRSSAPGTGGAPRS